MDNSSKKINSKDIKLNKTAIFMLIGILQISLVYSQESDTDISIIPAPVTLKKSPGEFFLNQFTVIKIDKPKDKTVVFFMDYLLNTWNFKNKLITGVNNIGLPKKANTIVLTNSGAEGLPEEGYRLSITPGMITIQGKGAGLFYGIQTLMQLFPIQKSGNIKLPCVEIEDYPRFGYRGLMLDVSRHFFTVSQVKDIINLMATYKLNRFHWHLTDDQGWRIEIKSFPKLTEVGAWRVPRVGTWNTNEPSKPGEKATSGGFYTQGDIKEIVQYAKERQIEILPEIDVPGHCMAAIASYPYLCCTKDTSIKVNPGSKFATWFDNGKYEMYVDNTLNPTDEKVYDFLDKVLTEVASLFPYEYIHIGGDECYKGYWEKDTSVGNFMKEKNLKNTKELQSYFIKRVSNILSNKGKKLIGWDEVLEGGLAPNATVMARFAQNNQIVPELNHNVIMTPGGSYGCYFDYAQSSSNMEPANHGGNVPLCNTYGYEPVPLNLSKAEQQYIMGVQGCLWTEHVPTVSKLQYMILPRALALSEVAWTPQKNKEYRNFSESRLPRHLDKFDTMGYNYRVPAAFKTIDTMMIGEEFTFSMNPTVPGAKIYYTFNGKSPSDVDREYSSPLTFFIPVNKKRELQTIVITPSGRRSVVTHTVMYNRSPVQPVN